MHGTVYICCCQCYIYQRRNLINSNLQKPLKPRSDHIKGKIKYQYHDSDETGNRCIFSCKNLINFLTSDSLLTLFWLYNCLFTQTLNKVKTHICDRSASVNLTLCFHLLYAPASPSHLCPASASQESADLPRLPWLLQNG